MDFSGGFDVEYTIALLLKDVGGHLLQQISTEVPPSSRKNPYLESGCLEVLNLDKVHNEAVTWYLGRNAEYRYGNLLTASSQRVLGLIIRGRAIAAITWWEGRLRGRMVEHAHKRDRETVLLEDPGSQSFRSFPSPYQAEANFKF